MPDKWPITKVGDISIRVTKGTTPTTIGGRFVDSGIGFIKVESITDQGQIDVSRLSFIDEESNKLLQRSVINENDILFTIAGTIGRVALVSAEVLPANTNQAVAIIRPNTDLVEPRFLYYALRDTKRIQQAHSRVVQSVQANFSLSELSGMELSLPERHEQKAISYILGALDDKIELNRRINETLESIARATFKSWFVDFDPVRAKADGSQPVGMDAETAALFPDSFKESTAGSIPAEWKLGILGDIAKNLRTSIRAEDLSGNMPYIGLEHMPRKSLTLSEWSDSSEVASNKSIFSKGDFLFGKLRPYFHKVGIAPVDGVCSTDILVIQPIEPEFYSIVVMTISSNEFIAYTDSSSTGTKMPRTNWTDMSIYEVLIPSPETAKAFTELVEPVMMLIQENISNSRTLARVRDALLPKLISGDIRVKDADKFVEEHAG